MRDGAYPRWRWWICAPVGLILTACSLGPSYRRPDLPLPAAWNTSAADAQATPPEKDWWRGFGSPQLDDYIARAQKDNDDIAAAMARVREADAQARIAGAALLPNLGLTGSATRERAPSDTTGPLRTFDVYTPALAASYELDFWGRNRELHQAALASAKALDASTLGDPALRAPGLGEAASLVASFPEVRQALLAYQRAFARPRPGAVLDGRDIGTVICPDAQVKLFVTATPEERARRRYRELTQAGIPISEAEVLADIRRRDERDRGRAAAPLRQAADAYLLDTTNLDIDAAFTAAIDMIDTAMGRAGHAS